MLPGDGTRDGIVNALDVADLKRRLGRTAGDGVLGNGAYSAVADFTGDGRINSLDVAALKQHLNQRVPPGPASAGPASEASITDFFGAVPILQFLGLA